MADNNGGEETDSDVEEYSGMEQPPLIKQLKTILAEYPDDGQIIKELVQNAEDAGATQMKILYDGRRINSEVDKKVPYRKFFKGPALCFYNNAIFSQDDWRGIKMIYSSVKEEDPLKVGRFGLGFKSVFHITDFPCIISGTRILLMNPHEKNPGKVCITMKLVELRKCKRLNIPDFLNSFSGTFGFCEQTLDSGNYGGTLFWFPLRETPSELSDTVYDRSKVLDLFKSFQSEATNALLFLKNLNKVELLCKDSQSQFDLPTGQPFFSVEVLDDQAAVKGERQKFLQKIKACSGCIPASNVISITHVCFKTYYKTCSSKHVEEKDSSLLVVNMYKGGQMSQKMRTLVSDKDLSYSPYVGVAVPMDGAKHNFKGHVFCFLPLPQEKRSLTGLPVHVNGFFALSQNRRHLKWASADQEALHMHRDKAIEWNECLVSEVLPQAYIVMVEELIRRSQMYGSSRDSVQAVYSCIPDVSVVDKKWKPLLKTLSPLLLKQTFVCLESTQYRSSEWMKPTGPLYTMFDLQNISSEVKECVRKALCLYKNVASTTVPDHVWRFVKKFSTPRDISPAELSTILKSGNQYKQSLTREDKMRILEYLLIRNDVHLLERLELLPLETGNFVTFQQGWYGASAVYVSTRELVELFPGLDHTFVSTSLPWHQLQLMEQICTSGLFQLQKLTASDVVRLLTDTLELHFGRSEPVRLNFSKSCPVPPTWIEKVWKYAFSNFPQQLALIQNLPLLPLMVSGNWNNGSWKNGEVHLYKMTNMFILKSAPGMSQLPEGVGQGLEHLSVKILESLPSWIDCRKLECIFYPTQQSVLQIFEKLGHSNSLSLVQTFNAQCSVEDRKAMVNFLGSCSPNLITSSNRAFLQQLALFEEKGSTNDRNPQYVSVVTQNCLAGFDLSFPVKFPNRLLVLTSYSSKMLAKALGAAEVSEFQLVTSVLQTVIQGGVYSTSEKDAFMKWFLQNISRFKNNNNILSVAKNIPFVSNGRELCRPSELFDPRDSSLASLFLEEHRFPVGDFSSKPFLSALQTLGLKKKDDLSAADILDTAKHLDQNAHNAPKVLQKANALFEVLEKNTDLLLNYVPSTRYQLHSLISSLHCIPHKRDRPTNYPGVLPWAGSGFQLCSPVEMKNVAYTSTAGSVLPLVKFSSQKLGQYFQWDVPPSATVLTRQLKCIINAYTTANKPVLLHLVSDVYKAMAGRITEVVSNSEFQNLSSCVWWEDGFCPPQQIVLDKQKDDIHLEPYMYHLPNEFKSLRDFFSRIGCYEKQDIAVLLSVQTMMQEKHKNSMDAAEVRKDLSMTIQILTKLFQDKSISELDRDRILFPTHTDDRRKLILKPANKCTFCDAQWLRDVTEGVEDEEDIIYVHGEVPSSIAEGLGVRSLRQHLMSDAEGLEEWGQDEPLTRRLHNLLKEGYTDGLSVPKEIIQNADDAGATEVCFLYDERENMDARTQLLDEGMNECQGPALWAYNNVMFTDEDLKNITQLSGATKEIDTTKIGKFGLGFCTVYNITDVPSFISGTHMVIFDPHTTHLGKALPGRSPGIRINLQKMRNMRMMKRLNNQFIPFQDVFGCDLSSSQKEPFFDGTLFRLPLRTVKQAQTSKIKNMAYTKNEMIKLLKQFVEASGNMLLFTQNLQKIKLFHIPPIGCSPSEAVLLCTVDKKGPSQSESESILKICSDRKSRRLLESHPLKVSQRINLTVDLKDTVKVLGGIKPGKSDTSWIISWATGTSRSLQLTHSTIIKGALPLGCVAMRVEADQCEIMPKSLQEVPFAFYDRSHIFCYLPLPVQSSLDVHVNGSFAVTSDRRSLRTNTEDDKYAYDTQWNEALLGDAVTQAFVYLLESLPESETKFRKQLSQDYIFHKFWPINSDSKMDSFRQSFYETVVNRNSIVFESQGYWIGLQDCIFLEKNLSSDIEIGSLCLQTLRQFNPLSDCFAIDLPVVYFNELEKSKGWKEKSTVVEFEQFFAEVFLPNIADEYWGKQEKDRNKLLLYCLNQKNSVIDEAMKSIDCFPTEPCGKLRKPGELVHPDGKIAPLFGQEESRIPEKAFRNYRALSRLVDLGMMKDKIPGDIIIDRAMTVQELASSGDFQRAAERCKHLINYLSSDTQVTMDTIFELQEIPFLPVMPKPAPWPFAWKGAAQIEHNEHGFARPKTLFMPDCMDLVACEELVLNTDVKGGQFVEKLNGSIFVKLGVRTEKEVQAQMVTSQLLTISKESTNMKGKGHEQFIDNVCFKIYGFLDRFESDHDESTKSSLSFLQGKAIICLGNSFVMPKQVAFSLAHDCSPELFGLRRQRITKFRAFLQAVGVRDKFDLEDFAEVLTQKKMKFQETVLPQEECNLVCNLLLCLTDLMVEQNGSYDDLKRFGEDNIVAPDQEMILRPTWKLCFDDCPSVEQSSTMIFVYRKVSPEAAEKLGVLTKRRRNEDEITIDIPFEQKEELVTRLHGLLDGYPCDTGIMKELIQNADDAGATEIHFLTDFRDHGHESIFDDTYAEFQGPALCVFNNSSFSQDDLRGIQQLGRGSKTDDPTKTGQYGVGFNAVYNLTDLPSFITKGPDIENGETLCLFDPLNKHLRGRVGTRIIDMDRARRCYPDIFAAYNEQQLFRGKHGTVFRFPFRRERSNISRNIITKNKLLGMFQEFRDEMFEMLLFLKNVTEISLSDISLGQMKTEYCIQVSISEKDRVERKRFSQYYTEIAKTFRKDKTSILTTEPVQVAYELQVKDNVSKEKTFFVVQRNGFQNCQTAVDEVQNALRNGDIGLMPLGGVAVEIPKKDDQKKSSRFTAFWKYLTATSMEAHTSYEAVHECKAFCFLPLPEKIGLHMHINGHFALDHEARRGLWKGDKGYKSDWNRLLLKDVIAKTYIEALKYVKAILFGQSEERLLAGSDIDAKIKVLDSFFPGLKKAKESAWKYLAQSILEEIIKCEEKVFPVVLMSDEESGDAKYSACWHAFLEEGHRFPVYFAIPFRETGRDAPVDVMKELGLKVISLSSETQDSLTDAGIPNYSMTADVVLDFLQSYSSLSIDKVRLGTLPCSVQQTKFKSIDNVIQALLYCSKSQNFLTSVDHLPLLVTDDMQLRCFSTEEPAYCSSHCGLFPHSAGRFVHRDLVEKVNQVMDEATVTEKLRIVKVEELLSQELDLHMYKTQEFVEWSPDSNAIPNAVWLKRLWQFVLEDYMATNSEDFLAHIHPLQEWCLIPVKRNESLSLFKVTKGYSVLNLPTFASRLPLQTALEKVALPTFQGHLIPFDVVLKLSPAVAGIENPNLLLTCLSYHKNLLHSRHLKLVDCNCIMGYFSDHLDVMETKAEKWWIQDTLRSLPMFVTLQGTHVSLDDDNTKVLVLPKGIPSNGIEEWASHTGTVLLRQEDTLTKLHSFLGFAYTEKIDVYLEHILATWHFLPDEASIEHLKYIKKRVLYRSMGEGFSEKQKKMIEVLKHLPVIPENGLRQKASNYFSPHVDVFWDMCQKQDFPPKFFHDEEWREFLELIGMQVVVTPSLFIQFAKQVAMNGSNGLTTERIEKHSKVLVNHLLSINHAWDASIFHQISQIKFIAPYKVDDSYKEVHKQYGEGKYLICFANAIAHQHKDLSWTSLHLLPVWANPHHYWCIQNHVRNRTEHLLQIHPGPTLDSVILHCQNVCNSLKECFEKDRNKARVCRWIDPFMEEVYEFLQMHGMTTDVAKNRLFNTPVVYDPVKQLFVCAHQVVEDMMPEQEIRPYLLKVPKRYGKFCQLFKYLGAAERPSFDLYIKVLAMVKHEVADQQLNEHFLPEWGIIHAAMLNLFKCLKEIHDNNLPSKATCPQATKLYLPSRQRQMMNSTQLVVSDNSYYEHRLGGAGNLQFVMGFKNLDLHFKFSAISAILWLPKPIRPKFLTEIVKEEVDTSEMEEVSSQAALKLQGFLQSNNFVQGILRLLKHAKTQNQKQFTPEDEEKVSSPLQDVRVKQVTGLKTYLLLSGQQVMDTKEDKECFIRKTSDTPSHWCIYFQKRDNEEEHKWLQSIEVHILKFINTITKRELGEHMCCVSKMIFMLNESDGIGFILDKMKIDPYDLPQEFATSVFPSPGKYVPVELHHLLNVDFSEIGISEFRCVALELEDAWMQDDDDSPDSYSPVYIYVQITKKVPTEEDCLEMNQKYEIFTGEEYAVVPAYKIYRFIRSKRSSDTRDVVDAGAIPTPRADQSLTKVYYSIRHTLREAWKLPEEGRRHVIKRLWLKWHPDKNIGNEDFCAEVFRYIKEVISKLENGIPLDDEDEPDGAMRQSRAYPDFTSSSYYSFCARMDRRSQFHRSHQEHFYSDGNTSYRGGGYRGGSGSYSCHTASTGTPYHDIGEAKRWQRQAKVDLRTAKQNIDTPGDPPAYNWVCYKCHQAAEKSLKAAWFVKDANKVPRMSHNLTEIGCGALNAQLYSLASEMSQLIGEHTKMRYPDVLQRPQIPSTVYTRQQAMRSCELASQILEHVSEHFLQ